MNCGDAAAVGVFDGDSLTFGTGSTAGNSYPEQTVALLGGGWTRLNYGVPSQTVVDMTGDAATQIDPLYSPVNNRKTLIVWGGTNDMFFGASGTTAYNSLVTYCTARKAAGWRVIVLSALPRSGSGTPGGFEANRTTFNSNLAADSPTGTIHAGVFSGASYADYFVHVGADATIGDAGDELNTTYYTDRIHLTDTGYGIIAAYVKNAISLLP